MQRSYLLGLLSSLSAFAMLAACSSSDEPAGAAAPEDGTTRTPAGPADGDKDPTTSASSSSGGTAPVETGPNPIAGIAAASPAVDGSGGASSFIDSVQWKGDKLFFTDPQSGTGSNGVIVEYNPGAAGDSTRAYRNPSNKAIGLALDKTGALIGCTTVDDGNKAMGRVVKLAETGAYVDVVTSGGDKLRSPNDLVFRKQDGSIYVTDPGYQDDEALTNTIDRISSTGALQVLRTFAKLDRPNGIALSKDENTLYVSFSEPKDGPKPYVAHYKVKADGSLEDLGKFVEFDATAKPDGLTTDDNGNVYVAVATGVDVLKPSGQRWGTIALPGNVRANNVRFGGADKKSLYVTSAKIIYLLKVNVAGRTD